MVSDKIIDMHTHTDNSFDGHCSTMLMCESAADKGIRAIAFTDHLEMDVFYQKDFDKTANQSFFEIAKARSAFEGRLLVIVGAEMGECTYDIPTTESLISRLKYDFVIGSIHNLPNKPDFCDMDFNTEEYSDVYSLLDEYFKCELDMSKWAKFDTLAHLTYPLRYMCGDFGMNIDMSRYSEIIDEILVNLVKNGKALEINTSGFRQKIGKTMPDESIVRRYRELGGELITIGSDAHYIEHLGMGIREGYELAARCGFDSTAIYINREPTLIPII